MFKIVRVDIVDNDYVKYSERLQDTFYLVDPNERKLEELQQKIKNRYEDDVTDYIADYGEIIDFIAENFNTIDIKTREIEW